VDRDSQFVLLFDLIEDLDMAFLARQGVGESPPDSWGERFFAALAKDHVQWLPETTTVYAAARRLILQDALGQMEGELSNCVYAWPERFLSAVIMYLGSPCQCPN
jgi:hypothetical protein